MEKKKETMRYYNSCAKAARFWQIVGPSVGEGGDSPESVEK